MRRQLIILAILPAIGACGAGGIAVCSVPSCASLARGTPNYGKWPAPPHSFTGAYPGGGSNGYDRRVARVHWRDGQEVIYGATFFLPRPFMRNIHSEVDLVRWDNFTDHPNDTDWGGVGILHSDHLAHLMRFNAAGDVTTLVGPFKLPIGRWFRIEVRQLFSDVNGQAFNEVYINNHLIGRSRRANTYGRPIDHLRAGLVAIGEGAQTHPLTLLYAQPFATGVSPHRFFHNLKRP